jgi:outer membrane protein TolC
MMHTVRLAAVTMAIGTAALHAPRAHAQADGTTRTLGALHRAAERADPRSAQAALLTRQSGVRTRGIETDWRPAVNATALTQYLSDVTAVGAVLPGANIPRPPNVQYDAYLGVRQRLYDATIAARTRVERAQLTEQLARVQSTVYRQRHAVNDAWFGVLRADVQLATLGTAITDLRALHAQATQRRALGAGLPSDVLLLDAELLRRQQAIDALRADRQASLAVLRSITGVALPDSAPLTFVDTLAATDSAGQGRLRPEFAQFSAARDALDERMALARAAEAPRVSAFSRGGYGKPGLNQLARSFDTYIVAGVQVDWSPFTWGARAREEESLRLQQDMLRTDETSFARELHEATLRIDASLDALDRALELDAQILTIRTAVLRETRARYAERTVTGAEVVDRETDVLTARLERDQHRVQRAELRARRLTLLGQPLP